MDEQRKMAKDWLWDVLYGYPPTKINRTEGDAYGLARQFAPAFDNPRANAPTEN